MIKILRMKKTVVALSLLAVVFAGSSCEKQDSSCNLVPARIIRYDCDRVIFQMLGGEFAGDADWTDVLTGAHYANVVSYYNTCAIAKLTNGRMDTLYVEPKRSTQAIAPDCAQCQAISPNPPLTQVDFLSVQTASCSGQNAGTK